MIHLFCALSCEAKPLITHFGLQLDQGNQLFKTYLAEDTGINLTITGVGKKNAAAAVSYHAANYQPVESDIWLNIGVAGHEQAKLGQCYLANKITDATSQHHWYPQFIVDMPCKSLPLITIDTPSNQYQSSLFDMEASGFYEIATRLGTNELIHCVKIISDNNTQHFNNINAKQVSQHITSNIPIIDKIVSALLPCSEKLMKLSSKPNGYEEITKQIHFTATEQIQLSRLLKKWQVRLPDTNPIEQIEPNMKAKTVIQTLNNTLENSPFLLTS